MFTQQSKLIATAAFTIALSLVGCGSSDTTSNSGNTSTVDPPQETQTRTGKMKLSSFSFKEGDVIPEKHTGLGDDVSPQLSWSDAPEGTKVFALICDDPDAPSRKSPRPEGPWVHWVIYNIPADTSELPESVLHGADLENPVGAHQGANDFSDNNVGYRGPMPPQGSGPHRYFFKIYALDAELDLDAAVATKATLLEAMEGHILDEGQLIGTFEVKKR